MATILKPFRRFSEHNVVNLYSTVESSLEPGAILEYVSADPDNQNGFAATNFANVPSYAFSRDYVVFWKVQAAASGSKKPAGILIDRVITNITDPYTYDARWADSSKLAETQSVPSGRAVRFVTEGEFAVTGIDTASGYAAPGSGAYISNSGAGIIAVGDPRSAGETRTRIGTFQTSSGVNGHVIVKVNIAY